MIRNAASAKQIKNCEFADAALSFLREKVPEKRGKFRTSVTGNFRVISPKDFRVVT